MEPRKKSRLTKLPLNPVCFGTPMAYLARGLTCSFFFLDEFGRLRLKRCDRSRCFSFFLSSKGRTGLATASKTGTLVHWVQAFKDWNKPHVPRFFRQLLILNISFCERVLSCIALHGSTAKRLHELPRVLTRGLERAEKKYPSHYNDGLQPTG